MKDEIEYSFSLEKNDILKKQRGICFDDVLFCLENDCLLAIADNKSSKYPHQEVLIVNIDNYVYAVPFVRNGNKFFMKTIYPSRILTAKYLNK